jgi:iron complex outermembrane recepter protein
MRSRHPRTLGLVFFSLGSGLLLCAGMTMESPTVHAQETSPDLTQMSIKDLLNVEVTTVSKREQKLSQTAAAVYVITGEDIARSGVTSVPEALRLAPGVQVAQINSSTWAIAIRGFNSQYSDKLLVLVDGRTVYSPAFSGVFWNVEDLPLEDIERIEVIRGPGASVWGANAVDGVINIITKSAQQTQGGLVSVTGGNYDQAGTGVRYGGKFGRTFFRVATRYVERGPWASASSGSNHDRWDLARIGLRADWASASGHEGLTLEGDLNRSDVNAPLNLPILSPPYTENIDTPYLYRGGSALLRWKHSRRSGSETTAQFFYDRSDADDPLQQGDSEKTFDFDFQQQTQVGARNDVVWGLGFRLVDENTSPSDNLAFVPNNSRTKLFSGFGQDEINLVRDRIWLTVGSKFEHNDYTGAEVEPSLRLLWAPSSRHSLWVAVSRAIRMPDAYEERARVNLFALPGPSALPVLVLLQGNSAFTSETEVAYELGYRTQATKRLSVDLASYYNDYERLSSVEFQSPTLAPGSPPHFVQPLLIGNGVNADSYGGEIAVNYQAANFWNLTGSYSLLRLIIWPSASHPAAQATLSNGDPEHQVQVHSRLTLWHRMDFDTSLYYFTALPAQPVPGYARLDVHLAWSPLEQMELSSGLQNLLDPRHLEFSEPSRFEAPGLVPRSFYGKVLWRF